MVKRWDSSSDLGENKEFLPAKSCGRKTLVLDLDETLIHSSPTMTRNPAIHVIQVHSKVD